MSVRWHDPVMTQPASRAPAASPFLQGGLSAAAALVLALFALAGPGLLLAGVLVMELVLVLGVLAVLDAPASLGIFALAAAGAAVAGVVVLTGRGGVDGLAGVVALALVASLLQQLARRGGRERVTESLGEALLAVVLVVAASCLVALRADPRPGARAVTVAAVAAAGVCLLVGRLGDRLGPAPLLFARSRRGLPGLLLGLVAGAGAGALAGAGAGGSTGGCALLGLAAAAVAAAADLAVDVAAADVAAAELRGGWAGRRRAGLRPVAALLPFALLGPIALLGGRLILAAGL